ncbi:DUF2786 domain-containing protein [Actinomadura rudentiformis]|uniref:DUF2786 domain-containing protein n=1 Tax=Actinomadura rudentiformis TaxID=359158 RepID=UPI00178C4CA5|nr:DUF2786 domain-containing protein [Actinomadura rudentiformis]
MGKAWRQPDQARSSSGASGIPHTRQLAENLIAHAVQALQRGDEAILAQAATELTGEPGFATGAAPAEAARAGAATAGEPDFTATAGREWRGLVDRVLLGRLEGGVTVAWQRGWQPADLVRFTGRRLGRRHQRLAIDIIAAEMRAYSAATVEEPWREQLSALGAEVWWNGDGSFTGAWCGRENTDRATLITCALELSHLLGSLPRLARIGAPPGTPPNGRKSTARATETDQRMLGKVRALLAKAESTEFPEEAEALSARAQELMARYSIDHALLAAESGMGGEPAGRRIPVDHPYDSPKAVLLTVVAEANRCRAVWHRELGFSTVLGFPSDLAAVEMLFTSLLVQATTAMVHTGARKDACGRSRTRSFRHAFLNAYAARIGERLRGAAGEATTRAAAEADGKDLLPVLAARDRAVEEAVDTMFPNLTRGRARAVSNYEGWVAGRAAADLASLNGRSEVTGE